MKTLFKLGLQSKVNSGTPDFSKTATTDEGIFEAPDDYGTSYYFRGAVTNNYVKFAGANWRIIRINGDGTIRMIYAGQLANESTFNTNINDNAYVGFMYGSTGQSYYNATHNNTNSSTIKGALDTWYNGLSSTNKGYIEDSIFCGDRTVQNRGTSYTGNGTGTTLTSYGAINRIDSIESPQLTCTNKKDRYTVSDTNKGNGALSNPVGLITADEVAMAGGRYSNNNKSNYLYTGQEYWTMSPFSFYNSYASVFVVGLNGGLGSNSVDYEHGVRPVVNLKSDITFTGGNGSQGAPWIVGTGNA